MIPTENNHEKTNSTHASGLDNLQEMAIKLAQKLKEFRYKHPENIEAIEHLEKQMHEKMLHMREALNNVKSDDRDFLTLLIIHEIHKSVDSILQLDREER